MQDVDFSLALCGFGPANSGLLFSLAKDGRIAEVAPRGIAIVERNEALGCGKLSRYRIPANTLADVILECVCDARLPGGMTARLQRSSTLPKLERLRGQAPDLDLVSECLSDAAELLVSDLATRHRISLRRRHCVEALIVRDDGRFDVTVREPLGRLDALRVSSVVLNLGGTQDAELGPGLRSLLRCEGLGSVPIAPSDVVLQQSDATLLAGLSPLVDERRTIVVGGSSHSAFSVVERLAQVSGRLGLSRIVVVHRTPPRFYHLDLAQASASGDVIDPVRDICPLTGRVNRLGGLRFRTAEVAREVSATKRLHRYPVEIDLRLVPGGGRASAPPLDLDDVAVMIPCFGYRPLLPDIRDQAGRFITLAEDEHGLATDDFGRPTERGGELLRGLFCFGLGSGMRIGSEVGGEPSYRRRLDGLWLYHNHVARKVTAGLLEDLRRCAPAWRAGAPDVRCPDGGAADLAGRARASGKVLGTATAAIRRTV